MALTVHVQNGSYQFDGPHKNLANINNASGVYVISTVSPDGTHKVLDVGESHSLQTRLGNHDRADQWQFHVVEGLFASVLYCAESARMEVESQIRAFHAPPCGIR